nr:hypothetical protein [Tanacetum cinerariifolium]
MAAVVWWRWRRVGDEMVVVGGGDAHDEVVEDDGDAVVDGDDAVVDGDGLLVVGDRIGLNESIVTTH